MSRGYSTTFPTLEDFNKIKADILDRAKKAKSKEDLNSIHNSIDGYMDRGTITNPQWKMLYSEIDPYEVAILKKWRQSIPKANITGIKPVRRAEDPGNHGHDESLKITRLKNAILESQQKSKYDDISPEEVIKLADKVRSMSIEDAEELFWSWYPHETSWSEMDHDLKSALIKVGRVLVQNGKLKLAYLPKSSSFRESWKDSLFKNQHKLLTDLGYVNYKESPKGSYGITAPEWSNKDGSNVSYVDTASYSHAMWRLVVKNKVVINSKDFNDVIDYIKSGK